MSALFVAVTGIESYQTRLDVIGNNLANLNTVGFKESRANFQDLLSQTIRPASAPQGGLGGVNPTQIGLGVQVASTETLHSQGPLQVTGKPTDLAIEGDGFFVLTDGRKLFFSRAGAFKLDANGNLTDPSTGYRVLASEGGETVQVGRQGLGGVVIPLGSTLPPSATTSVVMGGNLDATAEPYQPGPPAAGGIATTTLRVFDSMGVAHDLTVTFTKSATTRQWDYTAALDTTQVGTGTLAFTSEGAFDAASSTVTPLSIQAAALGTGANPMTLQLEFGNATAGAVTSTNLRSAVTQKLQDGYSAGALQTFTVERDGTITGAYSNGQRQKVARIALATFSNPGGLAQMGNNLFRESYNSGSSQIGSPLTESRGGVVGGTLEGSNVDLAREFTDMIVSQRGFQANSRVISAADELIQDLLALRR